MPIKFKLILSYIFVILISFGFISFSLDRNLEGNALQEIKSSLVKQAYLIQSQIPADNLKKENSASLESMIDSLSLKAKCRITIIDKQGKVLADSQKSLAEVPEMGNHAGRPEIKEALSGEIGEETHYSTTLKMHMLYIALPIIDSDGIAGVLRLALPLTSIQKMLFVIRRTIILSLLFAVGLAFVLSSILAAGVIKPVNKIILLSRRFSQGDFSQRIFLGSKDELGELAATLNTMAQKLEDKMVELAAQNQKLAAIFNSMIEGVIVVDKTSRIVSLNPAVERIFGVKEKEVMGRLFLEAIRNHDIAGFVNVVLDKGEPALTEISLNLPVQRTFQLNIVPIFEQTRVSGCLVVIHDITEVRKLETIRRDFVANVSHELKTPLTSIRGFVETLLDGALEDKEHNRNFLKIIHEHAQRLDSLINDLLSLSYLESREIKLDKINFNLYQQLEQVIVNFEALAENQKVELKNELPANFVLTADKSRIEQVLINLLHNAIKFNRQAGYVKVYNQDLGDKIKIVVEDSGIGIPHKDIPRIFERFYRVDKARSRELGGTGLGLSIVKHIIELHQGSVGVESSEGFGSKFFFILPK